MSIIVGIDASYRHSQNGMIKPDMVAASQVANIHHEVIIFRSTGPWSKRWIERGYPTKNFHVKGKSSNWGPQAGLVPYNGKYSKVGSDPVQAAKGTEKNDKGLKSGFADKTTLVMSRDLIEEQYKRAEGKARRRALCEVFPIVNSKNLILVANRAKDDKKFAFLAKYRESSNDYEIYVYPDGVTNPFLIANKNWNTEGPLEVMTSGETGSNNMPMTGDYDLLAICPPWSEYGSRVTHKIVKPGINLRQGGLNKGVAYHPGVGLDNVLDPSLHTLSDRNKPNKYRRGGVKNSLKKLLDGGKLRKREEHPDMGNLTPRILRCINNLNTKMGAVKNKAAFRRVHHNAESHRNAMFGAITEAEMSSKFDDDGFGDGFPFTVFQPRVLAQQESTREYGEVCTLETYAEFKEYATNLREAGYYVPKNWTWNI